jgi:sugar lactone lactonase YvrE
MNRSAIGLLLVLLFGGTSFSQSYTITTVAGPGLPTDGAVATTQAIDFPYAVLPDAFGGFYVSSYAPSRIYRIGSDGTLTIVAGAGLPGYSGDGGPAASAQINGPMGMALDITGTLFFADSANNCIRMITPDGTITTVAGNGTAGFSGDGGAATAAQLRTPHSVAVDSMGNLSIADTSNVRIRKVDSTGTINTIAGVGTAGFTGDGGPATKAQIGTPEGITIDASGNLFFTEPGNVRVREINTAGTIQTVAGNGTAGFSGDGGAATSAQLNNPYGVAFDGSGNLLITDVNNGRVRQVDPSGIIRTIAGNGIRSFAGDGGPATSAEMVSPYRVAADSSGNLFIADASNNRIRKIAAGIISTVAGNGTAGFSGDGSPATSAQLNSPYGVALDPSGNLLIADLNNNRLRLVAPSGVIATLAGIGTAGSAGDGGPAASAQLRSPSDVLIDPSGNVFIADSTNYRVRKITPPGVISTFAGRGTSGFSGDNGAATSAQFNLPMGLAMDPAGNLYISDLNNQRIRKVATSGIVTTVAGTGTAGSSGDGGLATSAQLNTPYGVAADAAGDLFIADTNNHLIRKVTPDGIIKTIAGTGAAGFSGDGGPATLAQLNAPAGVAVDAAGNVYVADTSNQRIRKIDAFGTITTIAGTGTSGFRGDGGPALSAWLAGPRRLTVDAAGDVFVADTNNQRIRELTPSQQSSTTFDLANGGGTSFQSGGSPAASTAVGYAEVVPDPGTQTPSGFAIIDFRERNILVSEAGVPGTGLIQSGRVYAESGGAANTGIAIANPNSAPATISFFFTGSTGDFGSGSLTIPPNGQIAKFVNEAPFNAPAFTGTLTFTSSVPVAVVALQTFLNERGDYLFTTLGVTPLPAPASTGVSVFPYFAAGSGWNTQLVLVNPTDTTLNGNLDFLGPDGQSIPALSSTTFTYSIPPRASYNLQVPISSSVVVTGSIHIVPAANNNGPSGLAIFSYQYHGITLSEAGIPAQAAGTNFLLYAEAAGDFDHGVPDSTRTGVAIANTSSQGTTAIVQVGNLDGTVGLIGSIQIPANGETSLLLNQIPGIETLLTPFHGILQITTLAPVTMVGIRALYNERQDLLITTTPPANESVPPPPSGLFFPHFADAGGFTTQFFLFDSATGPISTGTVKFVSQSGQTMNLVIR